VGHGSPACCTTCRPAIASPLRVLDHLHSHPCQQDGELFDKLEEVARRVRNNPAPFGGLQLILCGDFFQLPPVAKGGASFKFAFEALSWHSCVDCSFELTQVIRRSLCRDHTTR
jgi:hypothetical protein